MLAATLGQDAEKAFDLVNWSYVYRVVGKFEFHNKIKQAIQCLYINPLARVKINGNLGMFFSLETGTRQGLPFVTSAFCLIYQTTVSRA